MKKNRQVPGKTGFRTDTSYVVSKRRLRLTNVTYSCGFTFFVYLALLVLARVYDSQNLSFSLDVIALEVVLLLGALFCMSRA